MEGYPAAARLSLLEPERAPRLPEPLLGSARAELRRDAHERHPGLPGLLLRGRVSLRASRLGRPLVARCGAVLAAAGHGRYNVFWSCFRSCGRCGSRRAGLPRFVALAVRLAQVEQVRGEEAQGHERGNIAEKSAAAANVVRRAAEYGELR